MDEKSKMLFDEIKKKIDDLRRYEDSKCEDMPITLQLESDIYDFSAEEKSITFSFPVMKKELNPNGAMMGGIVCTALDMSYGLLVFALCGGGVIPPTVSMTTNFINAIFGGDTLLVTAKVESWGKRIINMSAKGVSKNTGKTIVTSTTVYISNADFKLK